MEIFLIGQIINEERKICGYRLYDYTKKTIIDAKIKSVRNNVLNGIKVHGLKKKIMK